MTLPEIITAALRGFYNKHGFPTNTSEAAKQKIIYQIKILENKESSIQEWEDSLLTIIQEERELKRSNETKEEPGSSGP